MSEGTDQRQGPYDRPSPNDLAAHVKELEARLRELEAWAGSVYESSGEMEVPHPPRYASGVSAEASHGPVVGPLPPPPPLLYRQLRALVRYVERLRAGYNPGNGGGPKGPRG